jgi:hypothetical protein
LKRIAFFDLDNSLANYTETLSDDMNALNSPGEVYFNSEYRIVNLPAYLKQRMKLIRGKAGWWRNLPPLPCGMSLLESARAYGYDIHILTRGPLDHPAAWAEKLEWCYDHLGRGNFEMHVTSIKDIHQGEFLYDDDVETMKAWLEADESRKGVMPIRAFNTSFTHPRLFKWDRQDCKDVMTFLGHST